MQLKRVYDHDAPKRAWIDVNEPCRECNGKGVVVNEALDGVNTCPNCTNGIVARQIPPVAGVIVQRFSEVQRFSPRLVMGGVAEGWLSIANKQIVIAGQNLTLTYSIERVPGKYDGERITYYDCKLVSEEVPNG